MPNITPRMMEVLAKWETCQLKSYLDNDGTWHVGYGHGNANSFPPFVDEFTVLKDEAEAMAILVGELNKFYVPQLDALFKKIGFTPPNDHYYCGFLDAGYNRGMGRIRDSAAYDWLKKPAEKYFMKWAAQALVFSHVEGFTPLDVAQDKKTGIERVHLGLTLRRIDDASMCLTKL